jgi:ATP synthase protein I
MPDQRKLQKRVQQEARRLDKAEKEHRTVLAATVYLGVLGLLFVLPVIAGAYLGRWLDSLGAGYSVRWTVSLILLGVVVGAVNVYLFIKE